MSSPVAPGDPVGAVACVRHPGRVTGLRCTRCDRPACPECLREASVGYHCVDCVDEGKRTVRRARNFLGAEGGGRPVVTPVLIGVNVLVFVLLALQAGNPIAVDRTPLFGDLGLWPWAVVDGEWWRFATNAFTHVGFLHLALNMLWLAILGWLLEPAFGKARFVAVSVLSILGCGAAVFLFGNPGSIGAGASGLVYGLMGAVLVAMRPMGFNPGVVLPVFVLNVVSSFTLPGVSLIGHAGGFVAGALVTLGFVYAPREKREWYQAAVVVTGLVLFAVLVAVRAGQLG
ncbi:MAG: rhomboid family intramembrane serine protease [Saccharothrix sp.]|nr:rhomboid family intramembrane serine protease [Saccharothrix sp.]